MALYSQMRWKNRVSRMPWMRRGLQASRLILAATALLLGLILVAGCLPQPTTESSAHKRTTYAPALSSQSSSSQPATPSSQTVTTALKPTTTLNLTSTTSAQMTTTAQKTTALTTTVNPTSTILSGAATAFPQLSNKMMGWGFPPLATTGALVEKYGSLWRMPATEQKAIYLTLDEAYEHQDCTSKILDTLKAKNVQVTFFVANPFYRDNPDKVKRMVNEGHLVANHTDKHPDLTEVLETSGDAGVLHEFKKIEDIYTNLTGQKMIKLVRPPFGNWSERLLAVMQKNGYRAVFWGFAYKDYDVNNQPDPAASLNRILSSLENGKIILIHASSTTNVTILPDLIDGIRERGYVIRRLDQ